MKILIIGLGSIGSKHLKNIKCLCPNAEINILHLKNKINNQSVTGINNIFFDLNLAIESKPDIAFLTCPAPLHIPIAKELAKNGVNLFIEKPISDNLNDISQFIELCAKNRIVVMIGYNLRFNPALCAVKKALDNNLIGKSLSFRAEVGQYLPDWRPRSDYRKCVSSHKETGGGALLELSHEIDYARWLMGEVGIVDAVVDHISDLEMDVEDIAEINLKFKTGALGNIHLDMISRSNIRNCKIIGTEGTLFWDGVKNISKIYSSKTGKCSNLCESSDRNDTYLMEIQHFFDCVKTGKQPKITIEDARKDLEIVLAAKKSSLEQRSVIL
ncbi:Gfo/Idh/MocA family oxidoreductase [Methanogenium marinum]|uniref:Gfo/Idh/MocA family oxidoreductase n=1 Tax=Methanogenium marinum TaxID=348610 RepID=A0A9Q4KU74_9EURY|nr:Gfo/Idh/MocA family oxidoreductase [Methanogenium marinum]MDE4907290.1 Gfo/Idh/MocA family oxidoreductase [Methanogenium marinum]